MEITALGPPTIKGQRHKRVAAFMDGFQDCKVRTELGGGRRGEGTGELQLQATLVGGCSMYQTLKLFQLTYLPLCERQCLGRLQSCYFALSRKW